LLNEKQSEGVQDVLYEDGSGGTGLYFYHLVVDGRISTSGKMLKN
jgi:hypothetical protein